jgi:translation initiation factor 2-alpha kinase 4
MFLVVVNEPPLTYQCSAVTGHPRVSKAAVFDIITPDLENGPIAASAEILTLVNDCLRSFPNLADNYEVHMSHSKSRISVLSTPRANSLHLSSVVDLALNRIPNDLRPAVVDIINQSKSSPSQKRALLLKKGLLRSTADELEVLAEVGKKPFAFRSLHSWAHVFADDDVDALQAKLEKVSPTLLSLIFPAIEDIKKTIQYATTAGFTATIYFHPLMWGQHHAHFKEGVRIEVVRRTKRLDVLAAAGR